MHRRNETCLARVPIGQQGRTLLWPGIAERYNLTGTGPGILWIGFSDTAGTTASML
jgi:hypothetical protein